MIAEGLSTEEASKLFYLIDKHGLITESLAKKSKLRKGLDEFVRPNSEWQDANIPDGEIGEVQLLDVVKKVKPTVLIGTSTHSGAFTEDVIRAMSKGVDRPIIFPLSNPSKLVEVKPHDANAWSDDKALLATGSPFPAIKQKNGKDYMYVPPSRLSFLDL